MWDLFQGCKYGSISANRSPWYITSTKWRLGAPGWLSWLSVQLLILAQVMVRVLGSSTMLGSMLSRECVWGFSLSQIFKKKKKWRIKSIWPSPEMLKKHLTRFNKMGLEETYLSITKAIMINKHIANIILNEENFQLTAFPLRSKTRQGC